MMQADFNGWIAGTGKAMANYGFGAERLDEFNRAAFATVKTGVTTFDELSKVMSVYAGSASAAKQDFSAANKMFSLFSVKVKSVDEAATLTKSLFNDLTKETTVKAFEKIGISMYDNNGKFRQADEILLELNRKFKELGNNDRSIVALKNQFTGSEGLIAYIQTAMDKTGQLQNTMTTFDATELGMVKATEIVKNDINYINQQLENRTKTLMAEIGSNMLPFKVGILSYLNNSLGVVNDFFTGPKRTREKFQNKAGSDMLQKYPGLANPKSLTRDQYDLLIKQAEGERDMLGERSWQNAKYLMDGYRRTNPDAFKNAHYQSGAFSALGGLIADAKKAVEGTLAAGGSPFFDPNATTTEDYDGSGSASGAGAGGKSAKNITGAAQPVKNITINIDSFVKGGINTQHTNLQQMDERQLERWFKDMFMRVMANMETSYQ